MPTFALQSCPPVGIEREGSWQHFQRDVTPEPRVTRPVDFAHCTRAERGQHLVRSESSAGRERG
jgi:hypothetical protein